MSWIESINQFLQILNWLSPIILAMYVFLKYKARLKAARETIKKELKKLKTSIEKYANLIDAKKIEEYVEIGNIKDLMQASVIEIKKILRSERVKVKKTKVNFVLPRKTRKNVMKAISPSVTKMIDLISKPPRKKADELHRKIVAKRDKILNIYSNMAEKVSTESWWKDKREKLFDKLACSTSDTK